MDLEPLIRDLLVPQRRPEQDYQSQVLRTLLKWVPRERLSTVIAELQDNNLTTFLLPRAAEYRLAGKKLYAVRDLVNDRVIVRTDCKVLRNASFRVDFDPAVFEKLWADRELPRPQQKPIQELMPPRLYKDGMRELFVSGATSAEFDDLLGENRFPDGAYSLEKVTQAMAEGYEFDKEFLRSLIGPNRPMCPFCHNFDPTAITYLEDIRNQRHISCVDEEGVYVESFYETENLDDGEDKWWACQASNHGHPCGFVWPVLPSDKIIDFV